MKEQTILIPEKQIVIKNPESKTVVIDWLELCFIQRGETKKVETILDENFSEIDLRQQKEIFQSQFFTDEPLITRGSFQLRLTGNRTRFWNKVFEVYYNGESFGTLCAEPHNHKIKQPNEVFFKLDNHWNYLAEWFEAIENFARTFELSLSHFNRLDIATDGFNFLDPVRLYHKDFIELVGRADATVRRKGNKPVHGFNLGSMKSDKYVRVYNKQKEIEQHSKKYYIREFWSACGVDEKDFEKMERLEVTMRHKVVKEFIGQLTWGKLRQMSQSGEYLKSLLQSAIKHCYQWRERRKNERDNVSRLREVCAINWNCCLKLLERVKVFSAKKVRALQTTAKTAYQLYLKTGFGKYAGIAYEIIENCNLQPWFEKRRMWWDYEYQLENSKRNEFLPLYDYTTGQKKSPILSALKGLERKTYTV